MLSKMLSGIRAICLISVLMVGPLVWAQTTDKMLIGGERAGPFTLGSPFSSVTQALGQAPDVFPSAADPGTSTRMYKKHKLAFLVNPQNQVIGITVVRADWKTAQGLGVGSPLASFQKQYGQGLKRGAGDQAFPQAGLAVSHGNGIVSAVYVVKKDAVDNVKGDHLVIGGVRAGGIRLGNSSQDMKALLGPSPKTEGANNQIWTYAEHGIRLAFVGGRLHLIGVTSGDWVTPTGLKVGRPFSEMKKDLGAKYRVEQSSVFYDAWGIGARLQGDIIVELLIFTPKKSGGQG